MSVDFKAWCRQNRQRCVLVELDYMYQVGTGTSATPTLGTLYLSNLGYVDESVNPPQVYDDCLLAVPTYERALDPATLRGAVQVSLSGAVSINNADGRYDFLLTLAIDGSDCRVYVGDQSWARADFVHVFTALQVKASASSPKQLDVVLADIGLLLNKSIGGTVTAGGTGPDADKYRPLCFGYVHNMEPILIDSATYTYAYNDRGTNASAPIVRDNGASLAGSPGAYTDNGDGTFTLTNNPQGDQITCDVLVYAENGSPSDPSDYRISDALSFFIGGEAGLTALGKYSGAQATYFDSGVSDEPLNDYHCGVLIADKTNVIDLLDKIMSTANGFWSQYRTGEFYYGRVRPEALPAIIGLSGGRLDVAATITQDDIVRDTLTLDHRAPTYTSYQCLANVNQTKQATFAGTLTADERVNLSRDGLVSAAFRGEDPAGTTTYVGDPSYQGGAPELYHLSASAAPVIPTLISGASDTDIPDPTPGPNISIPEQQAAWNAVRRAQFLPWTEFVGFTTFLEFYDLEIGDIINLVYPRWDLDGGELHQVYKIAIDVTNARVEIGVTRRRFAAVTGAVPPFDYLAEEDGASLVLQENGDRIIVSTSGASSVSSLLLVGGGYLLQVQNGNRIDLL